MSTWPGDEAAQYQTRPDQQAYGQALPVPAEQARPAVPAGQGQELVYHHVQPHSASLAVVASFFIPGLGSMLNEKVGKGIGILACYIVSVVLVLVLVGFIAVPAVWIWGMVAANNDAHKWNRAHGIMS
jgi:TM2 domain-containing membrane protein YozV